MDHMDATLRDRLILLEQNFLIAVGAHDEAALEDFYQKWSLLFRHFQAVEASGGLDNGTALLLSHVSQAIGATTQCMLECEDVLKDTQTRLMGCLPLPLDDLFPVATSCSTYTPSRLLFSDNSSSGTLGILGHHKLLDTCAYRWLKQNMHNPYPTFAQLQTIGAESMVSVTHAEVWFQEARDVVGWTRLSDEFFGGTLDATIHAAKRVFLKHDGSIPFSIIFAFSAVNARMETLFSEHPASIAEHVGSEARTLRSVPSDTDPAYSHECLDIEDTTSPPSVAGRKRCLPEDIATSSAPDLHQLPKRLRTWKSTTEAYPQTPIIPVTPIRSSDPSFSVDSKSSPDLPTYSSKWKQASETIVISSDPLQFSEGSSLAFSTGRSDLSAAPKRHLSSSSVLTFQPPLSPSFTPTDSAGTLHNTASPSASVDVSVFDWSSISNPLVETTISMNQPASVYVPSSDLAALSCELPDPLYLEQFAEQGYNPSLDDLGSLEDFSLLQFPIPTIFSTDVSASPSASFYLDNSTLPSPEMDWSAITDFIIQFSSVSAESSSAPSPSSTFDAAPSTPESLIGSLLPPPPHEVNKPISLLDPSIPPSAFLPAEPGIFRDDASSMWSLLC